MLQSVFLLNFLVIGYLWVGLSRLKSLGKGISQCCMAGERAVEDPSLSWRWANIRTLTFNVLRHFYFERYRCFPFLACIASVSVMLGSYERSKNRVYGVPHAQKMEQEPQ